MDDKMSARVIKQNIHCRTKVVAVNTHFKICQLSHAVEMSMIRYSGGKSGIRNWRQ